MEINFYFNLVKSCCYRRQLELKSATKLVEKCCPLSVFLTFCRLQKGIMKLSLPIPPCNVVPLLALSLGENKHPSFDRRRGYKDGEGGKIFFVQNYLI